MKRPTIKGLEADLYRAQQRADALFKELDHYKTRVKDISGENESLRMDKKWLQQVIQRLIELRTLPTSMKEAIGNALSR